MPGLLRWRLHTGRRSLDLIINDQRSIGNWRCMKDAINMLIELAVDVIAYLVISENCQLEQDRVICRCT